MDGGGQPPTLGGAPRLPFLAFWGGQTVSSLGTQISLVAVPLFAARSLGAGPMEMGFLASLEVLPYLLLAIPAGIVADRYDRRRVMIVCDLGRLVALLAIPLAFGLHAASMGLLYGVTAMVGALSAFFAVASQAYLPQLLPGERLLQGFQRLELSEAGARVAGPTVAGAVVQAAGVAVAVVADAVSYLVSAVALAMRGPLRSMQSDPDVRSEGALAGLRAIARDRVLRDLAISTAIFNLATGIVLAELVLFATSDLGLGPAEFGLLYGVGNVGFVVGALSVVRLERRLGAGRLLATAGVLGSLAIGCIAGAAVLGTVAFVAGRFLGAVASPLFNVTLVSLRQARTPDALRGRVNAAFRLVDWGSAPLGALLGGILGARLGLPTAMSIAAGIGAVSAAWIVRGPVPRLGWLQPWDVALVAAGAEAGSVGLLPAGSVDATTPDLGRSVA
ncbi:MAG TPA: MFS transporter [Candidatus Limnocylindrales bacterium]